ncbi:hypothetical protein TIFTF001_010608 [Ficus carica]|uniref:Uncharacterized protein n=1 Tax=Ficus carica TaxID=3494 RepID=A0AA87ZS09_FICCA|nr:hypothetical protein TIFTF001_010608 [Ficus carica]
MMEQRKGRRLILFPLPLQGHLNPMLDLANILHSKGFSLSLSSTPTSTLPTFQTTLTSLSSLSKMAYRQPRPPQTMSFSLISLLNIKCVEPFKECLSRLVSDDVSEDPVSCLITDAIFHFTQAVAESLKLPRIVLRTVSSSSFVVFSAFPLLREKGYLPIQVDNMVSATKASSGLMWNTFEDLEQSSLASLIQQFSIPMFLIGPFHKHNLVIPSPSSGLLAEDQTSLSWLKTQPPKSVVYMSFGHIVVISEQEFLEIAWGLAKSEQPFLWVVRPGLVHGVEWLEPLPRGFLESLSGRGRIVKWAPQQEVLPHKAVGAFWSHNGWNSTLESICEGVPMICMPCFGDRKVNARFVSQVWKVGLQLENGKLE